ncbi:MAG: hypothetical protein V4694_06905 [Pseudomonadota bacterium]
MHNQLYKFFSLLIFTLIFTGANNALAQETSSFSEANLPEKVAPTKVDDGKAAPAAVVAPGSKTTIISNNSLANMLLGNKMTSLMFNDEENSNIERAVESLKNNQVYSPGEDEDANRVNAEADKKKSEEKTENEKSYIYLASIIYFTAKDWVVWVNEQKITPATNKKERELYLTSVHKDKVSIRWTISVSKWKILAGAKLDAPTPPVNEDNKIVVNFDLKQNQTFILSANSVVEGKAVIAILKKKEEDRKARAAAPVKAGQ